MCDYFWQRMEGSRGDLADIVQSGSRAGPSPSTAAPAVSAEFDPVVAAGWQQLPPPQPAAFAARNPNTELQLDRRGVAHEFCDGHGGGAGEREIVGISPCSDDLLRILRISPAGGASSPSPPTPRPSPAAAAGMDSCTVDHSGGVQQISPRALGIKRRKSQAKKVVCIPAPIAASSRQSTGEVVPSDLWAWRKYGQKPIKGSPYPRGYYRCSSSKGCSARKQVERSRTDPNMLVITYTSEHNHPWPTQRNALAGSTRSHPMSKNSNGARRKTSPAALKEDEDHPLVNDEGGAAAAEEEEEEEDVEIAFDIQKKDQITPPPDDEELDRMMHYRPMVPEPGLPDDFFAELAELEADPVSLIFSKGFMETAKPEGEERGLHKAPAVDPFAMFDWGESS